MLAVTCLAIGGVACSTDEAKPQPDGDDTPTEETPTTYTGDPTGRFCENLRALFNYPSGLTPDQLRAAVEEMGTALVIVNDNPPAEVADYVKTFTATAKSLIAAFEAAEYDLDRVDYNAVEGMASEEYREATGELLQYNDEVCSLAVTPAETTVPDGMGEPDPGDTEGTDGNAGGAGEVTPEDGGDSPQDTSDSID